MTVSSEQQLIIDFFLQEKELKRFRDNLREEHKSAKKGVREYVICDLY